MKNALILLILPLLFGCRVNYPVAQQGGKEDMAYLLFVSPDLYAGKNVEVLIDSNEPFHAKVVKAKKSKYSGVQYGIGTGKHSLKITCEGKTLYEKKIFASPQEVKQIVLP